MRASADKLGLHLSDGRRVPWDEVYYVQFWSGEFAVATSLGVAEVGLADGLFCGHRVRRAAAGQFYARLEQPGQGLWLTDGALTEVGWGAARQVPLTELAPPVWGAHGPRLALGERQLDLGVYQDGRGLALTLELRLSGEAEQLPARAELSEAELETRLRVTVGGAVTARLRTVARWGWSSLVAPLLLLGTVVDRLGLADSWWGAAGSLLWALYLSVDCVQADARGVTVRRGRRREYYSWADVLLVEERSHDWLVTTRRDTFTMANAAVGSARLVAALQRVLATRESGARLPEGLPAPDTALSRLGAPDADSERGLSLEARPPQ